MKKNLFRLAVILLIPAALLFGFYIGYDVQRQEVERQTHITQRVTEVYGAMIDTAGKEVNLLLDINQGTISTKEGEKQLLELHKEMQAHQEAQKALNEEIGNQ